MFAARTVTALIGPNGAGKTTLLDVISGFLSPDEGTVVFDGRPLTGLPPHRVASLGVARTFQNLRLPLQMTACDAVLAAASTAADDSLWRAAVGLSATGRQTIDHLAHDALSFVDLQSHASQLVGALSYGQQKLLSIAMCIAATRRTLLLDEPFAGVHPNLIDRIVEKLRVLASGGHTVVLVEHDLGAVRQVAHHTIALAHGKIIGDGETAGVLESVAVREAFLAG